MKGIVRCLTKIILHTHTLLHSKVVENIGLITNPYSFYENYKLPRYEIGEKVKCKQINLCKFLYIWSTLLFNLCCEILYTCHRTKSFHTHQNKAYISFQNGIISGRRIYPFNKGLRIYGGGVPPPF